jgi:hypothetical protein
MKPEIEEAYDEIRLLRKRIRNNSSLHQSCMIKIIEITNWLAVAENGLKTDLMP